MRIAPIALGAMALLMSSAAFAAPLRFFASASWRSNRIDPADTEGIRASAVFRAIEACKASGAQLCEVETTRVVSFSAESYVATTEQEASAVAYDGLVDTTVFKDFSDDRSASGAPNDLLTYAVRGMAFWDATFACKRAGYDVCVHVLAEATMTTTTTSYFASATGHATVRGYMLSGRTAPPVN